MFYKNVRQLDRNKLKNVEKNVTQLTESRPNYY